MPPKLLAVDEKESMDGPKFEGMSKAEGARVASIPPMLPMPFMVICGMALNSVGELVLLGLPLGLYEYVCLFGV